MAIMCRFPAGYLEPRHQHESGHWGIIVDEEMHVDGTILRPGDFHHAPANVPQGPFYYPIGCTIFGTSCGSEQGASMLHEYDDDDAGVDPRTVEVVEPE